MSDCLDQAIIEELKLIMQDDVGFLFQSYLEDTQIKLEQLKSAGNAFDCDQTRRIAHSLKGSCKNVGASTLANLCELLETAARNEKTENWSALIENIIKCFEETREQINTSVLSQ